MSAVTTGFLNATALADAEDALHALHGRTLVDRVNPNTLAGLFRAALDVDLTGPVADAIDDLAAEINGRVA